MTRATIGTHTVLGRRYRLVRRIAGGGMGTVWESDDRVLHRRVAVKLLYDSLSEDERIVERFRREARAAAGLSHPNIAQTLDYGEDGDTHFIVMELVPGKTVAALLDRDGRLGPAEAGRIAAEAAEGLDAAHRAGIVHRDVKPGNVMVTPSGDVKVMDFGIAAAAGDTTLTRTGSLVGTAAYMAPERMAGQAATPASDVYSLGVMLYEMLAGVRPFAADTPMATAVAHLHSKPSPVGSVPGVSPALADTCERAMARDPADRPPSAAVLAAMLRRGDTDVMTASVPGADLPTLPDGAIPPAPHRRRTPVIVAAFVLVAAVLAILGWALGARQGERTPARPTPSTSGQASPSAPTSVTVPSTAGQLLAQAERTLRAAGLVVGSVVPAKGADPGVVVTTDPVSGTVVAFHRSVTVYVGAARPGKEHHDHGHHNGQGGNGGD